jgi:hypothetical protein
MICVIAIAPVVPLLIVSPHEAQRKVLRALRAYSETEGPTQRRSWRRPHKTSTEYCHIRFGGIGSCGVTLSHKRRVWASNELTGIYVCCPLVLVILTLIFQSAGMAVLIQWPRLTYPGVFTDLERCVPLCW